LEESRELATMAANNPKGIASSSPRLRGTSYLDIGIVVRLAKGRAYTVTIKGPQDKAALFWRFLRNHYRRG
jgi:hypothetical protein